MKKIFLILAAITLVACGTEKKVAASASSKTELPEPPATPTPPKAQAVLAKDATGQLTGIHTKSSFMQAPFSNWFKPRYENYQPDAAVVKELKKAMKGITVRAYMGTWCGDSKRETPHFYKLMDEVGFDLKNLTLVTVDRTKRKPEELVSGYSIRRVPTFIFYKNGEEIGRYVEYARESLEKDILKIVTGQDYKHAYDRS
jgi:thiol-disulfide isomerase/thioredoxin